MEPALFCVSIPTASSGVVYGTLASPHLQSRRSSGNKKRLKQKCTCLKAKANRDGRLVGRSVAAADVTVFSRRQTTTNLWREVAKKLETEPHGITSVSLCVVYLAFKLMVHARYLLQME